MRGNIPYMFDYWADPGIWSSSPTKELKAEVQGYLVTPLQVWPRVGIKRSQIFHKSCPKISHRRFYLLKVTFLEIARKATHNMRSFLSKFVFKIIQVKYPYHIAAWTCPKGSWVIHTKVSQVPLLPIKMSYNFWSKNAFSKRHVKMGLKYGKSLGIFIHVY